MNINKVFNNLFTPYKKEMCLINTFFIGINTFSKHILENPIDGVGKDRC